MLKKFPKKMSNWEYINSYQVNSQNGEKGSILKGYKSLIQGFAKKGC